MGYDDLRKIKQLVVNVLKVTDTENLAVARLGGMTNRNYKVDTGTNVYVVRIPGVGTENVINRKEEYLCTQLASRIGVDSELIYFECESGIKISRYIEEAQTMNAELVHDIDNLCAIAEVFQRLHTCNVTVPVVFNPFEKILEYELAICKVRPDVLWDDYKLIKREIMKLEAELALMDIAVTFCHNDPLCENFVKGKDAMYLVDWEYAGVNDPLWDLADLAIEADLGLDEEELLIRHYFGRLPTLSELKRLSIHKVLIDFLWSLWGMQRYVSGDNLREYGTERYNRAKSSLVNLRHLSAANVY